MSIYRRLTVVLFLLIAGSVHAQDPTPTTQPTFSLDDLIGIPVEGNLNDTLFSRSYFFNAVAGAEALIFMDATSGGLDPLLILYAPNGDELARNDDREQGELNAAIQITLPSDGTYTIEATRRGGQDGTTVGSYALVVEIQGEGTSPDDIDPLSISPNTVFRSVNFEQLAYQDFAAGELNNENPRQYFVVGGDQGDFLRAILTVTTGEFSPVVNILTTNLTQIGSSIRPRDGEVIAFSTLPRRNWYLIEITRETGTGSGSFSLFIEGLAVPRVEFNAPPVDGEFTVNAPSQSYIFEGQIGDLIFASVVITEGDAAPEIRIVDIAQREIARTEGNRFTSLQSELPRSGTYILQINNTLPEQTGSFNLRLSRVEASPEDLQPIPAEYNEAYSGNLTATNISDLYEFEGKAGELITVEMTASSAGLDPFLVLMDSDLNELVVNDNNPGTLDASLSQYALPEDGTYYLLAARSGLAVGDAYGNYTLELTVGSVELIEGSVAATLTWRGDDDLNLFIREPSGRVISWSNPESDDSGNLQIDSNTDCNTISAQPIEHIYWDINNFPENGDYQIWIWYQNACGREEIVEFAFQLKVDDAIILDIPRQELNQGERFNIDIRVSAPQIFILDAGRVTQPSPQQRASEGGDIPILYGQERVGSISEEVYARFYQFEGSAGDKITVEAERATGDLDPVLVLRDDEENTLTDNDDISRTNRNSRIEYILPYTGRYVIAATRFGVREGLTSGDYVLRLYVED